MDHPKKILILHASAGHGHEKAAKAISEAFEEAKSPHRVQVVDALSLISLTVRRFYKWVYFFQIQYLPWLWGFFYFYSDLPWVYVSVRPMRRAVNGMLGSGIDRFLIKENPDILITTHFLSTEVASHLKKKGKIRSRLVTLITDYLPHRIWTASEVDNYLVALPETKEALIHRGVPENKIKVFGIPVEKKFLMVSSRELACAKLRLEVDRFTVLITGGGAGIGDIGLLAEGLLGLKIPIQVIIVCGTNQALQETLAEKSREKPLLKVFGFVDNMEELMETADLVIGKGGGLTITESFVKGKPIILYRSVPGQETRNVFCVEKYKAGFGVQSATEAVKKISFLLTDPKKIEELKMGLSRMARPLASKHIVEWVEHEIQ